MSRFAAFKSGHPLHGIGEHLLALVFECAPHEQLCAWLRAPLEHAAANSNGDLVMMLLAAGADAFVRSQSTLDRPHLAAAAQGGNRAVVSALIASASAPTGEERLFDILGGDDGNVTAVAGGGTDKGADVVSETRSGIGSSGSDSGSDSGSNNISDSASTSSGSTSSSGNSRSGNSSNSSSKSSSGCRTPLHFAASGGHVSAVKALVQAGVDIDVVDEEGCSALHLAVFRGFDKVVEELVSAGANVDTSDSEGETPLHTACGHGNLEMVRALLRDSRRQALSARGNRGVHLEMSPLHRASLGGHCQIMEELLHHGSNLDSLTGNARTPLHAVSVIWRVKRVGHLCTAGESRRSCAKYNLYHTPSNYCKYHGPSQYCKYQTQLEVAMLAILAMLATLAMRANMSFDETLDLTVTHTAGVSF